MYYEHARTPYVLIIMHVFLCRSHTNTNNLLRRCNPAYDMDLSIFDVNVFTGPAMYSQNRLNMNRMPYSFPRALYSTCRAHTRTGNWSEWVARFNPSCEAQRSGGPDTRFRKWMNEARLSHLPFWGPSEGFFFISSTAVGLTRIKRSSFGLRVRVNPWVNSANVSFGLTRRTLN